MRIRRLKLSGFKSFVEPAELLVEPGLTGIVGPNGCGKSNLLEAIRWVMGEGSAKSLRGGAMDDVIFAGTAARPARDFAEVSLLADGEPGDGAANDLEVEVVRRIERGAGSAYRINGRDARAKDVALLFADSATGAHSPALVSQGRIGAIIAARPAERRLMLEEAAGIAGLHARRKDAEQKLRATEANLARLDEIAADRDQRINQLRRQARAAERYRKLSRDIQAGEAALLFVRWREAAAAADHAREQLAAAETAVAATAADHAANERSRDAAAQALAAARADALASRDRANDCAHHLASLRAERAALDRRLVEVADQQRQLGDDRGREAALAHDAGEALERLTHERADAEAALAAADQALPGLVAALAEARDAAHASELALAQALAAQATEQAAVQIADAAVVAADHLLQRLCVDVDRADAALAALAPLEPLLAERTAEQARGDAATAALAAAETAIATAAAALAEAVARHDEAAQMLAGERASLAALDAEFAALQDHDAADAGDQLLARITVEPGFEAAVAAAFGDDLSAPVGGDTARRWAGAAPDQRDPPLPPGMRALADVVHAPPELARRLKQIGLVDRDDGGPLAVGQRVVTRDGLLRRWDGYRAQGGDPLAAERLVRRNRLIALVALRDAASVRCAALVDLIASAQEERSAGEAALAAARRERDDADRIIRDARRAQDRADSAIERLAGEREALERRHQAMQVDRDAAARSLAEAQAARALLPDGRATAERVATLRAASETRGDALSRLAADHGVLVQSIEGQRQRLQMIAAQADDWRRRAAQAVERVEAIRSRADRLAEERSRLETAPNDLDARIVALESDHGRLANLASVAAEREAEEEAHLADFTLRLQQSAEASSVAREARATAAARAEAQDARRTELARISGDRFECPPPLLADRIGFDPAALGDVAAQSALLERLVADRERLGPVNLVAADELAGLETEQQAAAIERGELVEAVARLRGSIGSLNREGRSRLLAAFTAVNAHFERLFATLFNGGQAHLALVESDDPLEAGLEIMAQPPGKKLATLTLLSGGEQALTAVALIFALFLTNPAPICVLDEVDAPLDDANVDRFCDLLDRMVAETRTRYLIVTHNAVTMARMHRLFGVTMIEQGVSRLVSVDLVGAERLLAAE